MSCYLPIIHLADVEQKNCRSFSSILRSFSKNSVQATRLWWKMMAHFLASIAHPFSQENLSFHLSLKTSSSSDVKVLKTIQLARTSRKLEFGFYIEAFNNFKFTRWAIISQWLTALRLPVTHLNAKMKVIVPFAMQQFLVCRKHYPWQPLEKSVAFVTAVF